MRLTELRSTSVFSLRTAQNLNLIAHPANSLPSQLLALRYVGFVLKLNCSLGIDFRSPGIFDIIKK